MRRYLPLLLPLLVLLAGIGLRHWDPPVLKELRYRAFDLFQRLDPRDYDSALPVRIVAIDEESLERYGQWPWPRSLLAELVEKLTRAGAAAIAFDAVFPEPDRSSPASLVPLVPEGPARQALELALASGALVDNDGAFAEAIAAGPVVMGFAMAVGEEAGEPVDPKGGLAFIGESPLPYVWRFDGTLSNLPSLNEAAAGLGSFSVIKDRDGTIRRVPLILAAGDKILPSLSTEALRVAQGAKNLTVKVSGSVEAEASGAATGVQAIRIGRVTVESLPTGELWLYDSGRQVERFVPAWQVLDGSVDPARIAGNIVLVGSTAVGLFDAHSTPLSAQAPGVEQHAQALEQMLTGVYLSRPLWAEGAEKAAVIVVGVLVLLCFAIRRLGATWAAVLGFASVLIALGGAWYAFAVERFLLDPLTPSLVGLLVYGTAAVTGYLDSERQRREVRTAFGQYVSPAVVARIAANPRRVPLGGESKELTLLFCDIQGFTTFSERLEPQVLTRLINRFLTEMSAAVLESGGTIDKYMGDCLMAFWNAPLDVPAHRDRALGTVLEMRRRLVALNQTLAAEYREGPNAAPASLKVGIGLNSGPCSVGNMGSAQRLAYTAVGDAVNLASRLEGLTRLYGVDCLASESTAEGATAVLLEIDRIRVKGKAEAVTVHALLGPAQEAERWRPLQEACAAFLAAFRAGDWTGAAAALERLRPLAEGSPAAGLPARYARRLEEVAGAPPPAGWDGTFVATEK